MGKIVPLICVYTVPDGRPQGLPPKKRTRWRTGMNQTSEHKSCRAAKLRRQLKKKLCGIRRAYAAAVRGGDKTEAGNWLRDNFYLIENLGRSITEDMKGMPPLPAGGGDAPRLYETAAEIAAVQAEEKPEDFGETIRRICREAGLQTSELEQLCGMLGAALVETAYTAVQERDAGLLSSAVGMIRSLPSLDFTAFVEELSEVEAVLRRDPAGLYPSLDPQTRADYRHRVALLARENGREERREAEEILKRAVQESAHVGRYLYAPAGREKEKKRGVLLLSLEAVLPGVAAAAIGLWFRALWIAPLLYFPLWEIIRPFLEGSVLGRTRPERLPRFDFGGVVPKEYKTAIVVSALLPSPAKAPDVARHLEQLFHTNGRGEVKICLLADFKEYSAPSRTDDSVETEAIAREIRRLNRRHDDRFILLVRPRVHSKTQRNYSGWERKRGALLQLAELSRGKKIEMARTEGDIAWLSGLSYILALDADTGLLMDTAAELVAIAAHPNHRPHVEGKAGRVTSGYGILATRVGMELHSSRKTAFSRVMNGVGGVQAYDDITGNLYQDMFGDSIFAGKGLIDVDAFLEVMEGLFLPEQVLSHDILEGGFLRTAYVSDIEMTDGAPAALPSWMARLHRWIRGDWQNLPFLVGRISLQAGRVKNPLSALSRYKLFDNLRRSFTPVSWLACLLAGLFCPPDVQSALAGTALLSAVLPGLFGAVRSLASGGFQMLSRRYYAGVLPAAAQSLLQAGMAAVMMLENAVVSLDAILRALWRRFVSHKNLMQWVTAADSEKKGGGAWRELLGLWRPLLLALIFTVFASAGWLRFVGILGLLLYPVSFFTGRPAGKNRRSLSDGQKETLTRLCASMWRFYGENAGEEDHFLPPDNIQESPIHSVAHRTSPTNIGLMLLCTLAARDLGFIDSEELSVRVSGALDSIEKLEKWHGNLLNWYDTRTLRTLHPRYVSSVDSGNFVCCLVALREGLRDYARDIPSHRTLHARLTKLISETDLSVFYNPGRRLFHIGYDLEQEKLSGSYYDLLMSESRLMSYFAIATRQVPKKQWGSLGRTLAREGRYTGPVSWTGSMFEYFMPHLLLPIYEGSFGYEALRFCGWCQRKRVAPRPIPWGISESGFYAFDPEFHYQYKAHGVQKLGLKHGLDEELVISPYSTFLTLLTTPQAAFRNLAQLEKMELTGRYGFFEAVDYTKKRVPDGEYAVVRSFMAHHVGMSMLAAASVLCGGRMQERFMRDADMAAAGELLEEKVPSGARVFEDVAERFIPDKPGRQPASRQEYDRINPQSPRAHLLTNGEWSCLLTDCGTSLSTCRGLDITMRSGDILRRPQGIFAVVRSGDTVLPVTSAPDYSAAAHHQAVFASDHAVFLAKKGNWEAGMMAMVHPRLPGEQRQIVIKNHSGKKREASLLLYLEPSLAAARDMEAHPAFSKLFLEAEYDAQSRALCVTRRVRGRETPVCLCLGFADARDFSYETSRERALLRPLGAQSLTHFAPPMEGGSGLPDPCAALELKLEVPPRGQKSVCLMLCEGYTKEEAVGRLTAMRASGVLAPGRGARSPFTGSGLEARLLQEVLPALYYPVKLGRNWTAAARENKEGQPALWQMGISGDNPIVLIELHNAADTARMQPYVRLHKRLRNCGTVFDLAAAFEEGGDYALPILTAVKDLLHAEGCEGLLGVRGGIHAVDYMRFGESARLALIASARYIAPSSAGHMRLPPMAYVPFEALPAERLGEEPEGAWKVEGGYFFENAFTVTDTPRLPWCWVLANEQFGTLLSDSALGFTWAHNARENKLTPWYNDTRSDNRGEMLLCRMGGKVYDLIRGSEARFEPGRAVYTGHIPGLRFRVTVWVPSGAAAKRVELECSNETDSPLEAELAYYCEPVLGVDRNASRLITAAWEEGGLLMNNPWNSAIRGSMYLTAEGGAEGCCCDRGAFLSGRWSDHVLAPLPDPCAAVIVPRKLPPKRSEKIPFVLSFGKTPEEAKAAAGRRSRPEETPNCIFVHTPDPALNHMVNTFLPAQTLSSRFHGRTGFYQCGGAWGFRDQLQDSCALLLLNPELTRGHILRCCRYQFAEGDVMHWWHELPKEGGGAKGVRTRCSDDRLWLPYTVCEYLEKTGDRSVLKEEAPFLAAAELREGEQEQYIPAKASEETADVYEHCVRAVEYSLARRGEHGLPLIGNGDWNDGFNSIGEEGKGESVWLAQFLSIVLTRFAGVCAERGEQERAERYRQESEALLAAVDRCAWDGGWYLRAFFDDGTPLGTSADRECRIDSISQSFAALSGMPDKERVNKALDSAYRELVMEGEGIVRLFRESLENPPHDPGYIRSYLPGVRENGGQYTHAAVWLALAFLREGRAEQGWRLIRMLNPALRTAEKERAERYLLEPYAMPADIYTHEGSVGRGGWSLYTGAAGWYYRTVVEALLGIRIGRGRVEVSPCIPAEWDGFGARLQLFGTDIELQAERGDSPRLTVDGQPASSIPLDGRRHRARLILPREAGPGGVDAAEASSRSFAIN